MWVCLLVRGAAMKAPALDGRGSPTPPHTHHPHTHDTTMHVLHRVLIHVLHRWESFAGEDGRDPRLYELPPPMQAVAVRPLTLDSAQSYIAVPSVKHRFPAQETAAGGDAGATSTFARFFTWGGGAKK